jgi:hypothetical protein
MKKLKLILLTLSMSLIVDFILIVLLRQIRALFPLPEIGSDKIIGYAQYFGYPLSFDTLLFFALILVPLFVVLFTFLAKRNK